MGAGNKALASSLESKEKIENSENLNETEIVEYEIRLNHEDETDHERDARGELEEENTQDKEPVNIGEDTESEQDDTEEKEHGAQTVYSEEEKLFREYRDNKDIHLRNAIVSKHMYLIDIITRKFINRGVEYEDLYQIASIALIKAVERFDLEKGVKFVSFATPTIVGEIKRYFRDKGSTIRIPRRIYEIYRKVNQAKEYLSQFLGRTPMVSDIAQYLKISEENVLEIIESWNVYNMQSFEQNVYSEDNLELHETIGEEDFEFEKIENRDFIEKSMMKLNESEREFITFRYMNDMTQKEIASVMKVSQMYISRLEKKIIKKFRIILEK